MASTSQSPRKRRARVLRTLSQAQQVSALAFGSFLVVHLSAPALAFIAPPESSHELATGTMLLGRVWYQSALSEPVLVWGALGVHLASSLVRKAVVVFWAAPPPPTTTGSQEASRGTADESRGAEQLGGRNETGYAALKSGFRRLARLSDAHTLSGTLLVPFVLHHAYLNRIVPSRPQAPINALSPSELNYTYVAHGFGGIYAGSSSSRALVTSALYGALIGLSVYHTSHGLRKILHWRSTTQSQPKTLSSSAKRSDPQLRPSKSRTVSRKRPWNLGAGIATAVLCGGLIRIVRDADRSPAFLAKRFEVCYSLVWPYSR
ncbi:hypothetical protein V8E36_000845 [Tilletia maclaganii]